jgi:hypothetical protein
MYINILSRKLPGVLAHDEELTKIFGVFLPVFSK